MKTHVISELEMNAQTPSNDIVIVWDPPSSERKSMRLVYLVVIALFAASVGCGDPPPSEYPRQEVHTEDSTLRVGDILDVRVYRQDEMSGTYEVSIEGTFTFPLIGVIEAAGKTSVAVERELNQRLADGYLQAPSVSVLMKESRSKAISVLGEVAKPVSVPYSIGLTVIDAITNAGGFTASAKKNAVTVTRSTNGKKTRYTVPAGDIGRGTAENFYVRPGDVVFVQRRTIW